MPRGDTLTKERHTELSIRQVSTNACSWEGAMVLSRILQRRNAGFVAATGAILFLLAIVADIV
ncbi:MAG: hypothetical protein AcusKO_03410 [Acuticoccus sp.]